MTVLTSDQRTDYENDLAAVLAHITAIDSALTNFGLSGTKSYNFDSGTGRQQEQFSSPQELLDTRKRLIAERDLLRRILDGSSILTQKMRR